MEDGPQANMKVGAIIQARMNSSRLPGKVLMPMPFPNGQPMIKGIVSQLRKSEFITEVIVATTSLTSDDAIYTYCIDNDIVCYRGDVNNVYERFYEICKSNTLDHVVRITGDNPFIDVTILDQVISTHINNQNTLTTSIGLPLGMNNAVLRGSEILKVKPSVLSEPEQEHVTLYFKRKGVAIETLKFYENEKLERMRLTIDYPSDMGMASILYQSLIDQKKRPLIHQILDLQKNNPWVFEINNDKIQKVSFKDMPAEVQEAKMLLAQMELNKAAGVLNNWLTENNK